MCNLEQCAGGMLLPDYILANLFVHRRLCENGRLLVRAQSSHGTTFLIVKQ